MRCNSRDRRSLLTGAGLALFLAGCNRIAPVYVVSDAGFRGTAPLPRRGDQIRRAYNGWVQDLERGIVASSAT